MIGHVGFRTGQRTARRATGFIIRIIAPAIWVDVGPTAVTLRQRSGDVIGQPEAARWLSSRAPGQRTHVEAAAKQRTQRAVTIPFCRLAEIQVYSQAAAGQIGLDHLHNLRAQRAGDIGAEAEAEGHGRFRLFAHAVAIGVDVAQFVQQGVCLVRVVGPDDHVRRVKRVVGGHKGVQDFSPAV